MSDRFLSTARIGIIASLSMLAANAGEPVAYVSSTGQDVLTSFNSATESLSKLAAAGIQGTTFAISKDGTTAYVLSSIDHPSFSASLHVVDLVSGKLAGTLDIEDRIVVSDLLLSPDDSLLYLVTGNSLTTVSTSTRGVVSQVPLTGSGCPCRLAFSPDGQTLYVTAGNSLELFDVKTENQIVSLGLDETVGLAVAPDGSQVYVLRGGSAMISIVDASSDKVIANIPYVANTGRVAGMAISPDGSVLYVTSARGFSTLSAVSHALIDQIPSVSLSGQILPSPDGMYVYINRLSTYADLDTLAFSTPPGLLRFDTSTRSITSTPISGPAISEQILSPDGVVYVLQGVNSIIAEDVDTGAVSATYDFVSGAYSLSPSPSGNVVAGLSSLSLGGVPKTAVTLISTTEHKTIGQFNFTPPSSYSSYPFPFALSGDGATGYMGMYATATGYPSVAVLGLPSGGIQRVFPLESTLPAGPVAEIVSPDGSALYTLSEGVNSSVCSSNLATSNLNGCVNLIRTGFFDYYPTASKFIISDDGSRLYIAYFGRSEDMRQIGLSLWEVEATSLNILGAIRIYGPVYASRPLPNLSLAYCMSTGSVYIAAQGMDQLVAYLIRVDLDTFKVVASQRVKYSPSGLAVTHDGKKLLVTGYVGGIQVFDPVSLAFSSVVPGGFQQAIVLAPQ